jgi:beta-1,4-mannosyl-glycoprotein beta-1,4-N-acetylglucosaminyltransferase
VRTFDCFLWNGEWDLLRARLDLLKDVVDTFVLVEGNRSFRNRAKPFVFEPQSYPQIRYVAVNDFPPYDGDPWGYEAFQRRALTRGLWDARPEDRILVSDADELFDPAVLATSGNDPLILDLDLYYYWLDCRVLNLDAYGPFQVPFRLLTDPFLLRKAVCLWHSDQAHLHFLAARELKTWEYRNHAGWSFSFLESPQQMRQKLQDFSHDDLDTPQARDLDHLAACRQNLTDIWDRGLVLEQAEVPRALWWLARQHPEWCHRLDTAPTVL